MAAAAPARIGSDVRQSSHLTTVLVVEDEAIVCAATCEVLQREGYRVLAAGSLEEARRIVEENQNAIQLALCDTVLPDGSGIEFAKTVFREFPETRFILISGYPGATGEIWDQCSFLPKPYSASCLLSNVRSALAGSNRRI